MANSKNNRPKKSLASRIIVLAMAFLMLLGAILLPLM